MYRSADDLRGYQLHATDGPFAKIHDFLFDDQKHVIRYLVADTGTWLPGRRVLISPVALGESDGKDRTLKLTIDRKSIESSPPLESDLPVSRQLEQDLARHYGWPHYWTSDPALGAFMATNNDPAVERELAAQTATADEDEHLRSVKQVIGYGVEARDGEIGHIEDLIIDTDNWSIRFAVIDTKNWWPGRKVMVGFQWMEDIDWAQSAMRFNADREQIRKSPEYDPRLPVNREYEQRLYDFYGRPLD